VYDIQSEERERDLGFVVEEGNDNQQGMQLC